LHARRRAIVFSELLETRQLFTAPANPVIIEPFADGQVTGTFDINLQTDPNQYSDPDGDSWQATEWRIRQTSNGQVVWQTGFLSAPPLTLYRTDFSDGAFVGALAGKTELAFSTNYQLVVRYRDDNSEISAESVRNFSTTTATTPVPGAGLWLTRPGYVVEPVQSGLRLPVNIAFVPNPGPNPNDPLYYVAELYGSIQVVRNNGTRSTFATGLLDYNPQGPISGVGEQGLTGLAVERDSVNPNLYNLYVAMLWDNGSPAGAPNHYPKVERLTSAAGGLTLGSRSVLLNMQPEIQGQSHQISNVTIGSDNKLYVHMGDGFNAATALNLDLYRGKILRMNKNGTPVATGDPAGANPFYSAANGINARDYVYTYGHRNPFGGATRPSDGKHWMVENGNSLDRMSDLVSGQSYGWAGNDSTHVQFSKYIWDPATAPVNMDFVDSSKFGGSMFPAEAQGHAYVSLSGSTYAAGPLANSKAIVEFSDLDTLNGSGKLAVAPSFLVRYNGTGRATVAGLAAGPDGLYFSDLYEDTGSGGATGPGSTIYRVRYVGNSAGLVPTVATPASANQNPVIVNDSTSVSVLGADDGGEAALTYTWLVTGNPPGTVGFSTNGTNAAKNTVATFSANGTYNLFVLIRDIGGQLGISNVVVNVSSVLTPTGNGTTGQYWSNINFTGTTITRTDPAIDFTWGSGGPDPAIGSDTFSARWTGFLVPQFTQTYTFHLTTDDGSRLWVNNLTTPIIDAYFDHGSTETYSGTINLTAGTVYPFKVDYYENAGGASAKLLWSSASQPMQIVPQGRLYTVAPTSPSAPTNLQLSGATHNQINLNWTDTANNESGFRIERGTDGTNFTLVATVAANVNSFVNTGLNPGTTYFYRVRSTNPAGTSNFAGANIPTIPTAFNGTAAPDIFFVRRNGTNINVWIGSNGAGSPTYVFDAATAPLLTFNGNDGADTLTLDHTLGSVIPTAGLHFNGGNGADTLAFVGSSAADSVTFTATSLTTAGATATHTADVESRTFDGGGSVGDALTINGGVVSTVSTQVLTSLSIAPNATLDLNNNNLIIDYQKSSQLGAIQNLINTARAGGAWTGTGITSTAAKNATPKNTTLAAMEASDFQSLYPPDTPFSGQPIDATMVLVKYTYYGDTDFNGGVDFDDYSRVDLGFNNNRTGWMNGDADGNGVVDFDDYSLIDQAFNTQGATLRPSQNGRGALRVR
ncbi:MAG: PQQ-dependent sugar dehydrogenase, partial [Anaerolineae bacterium]|nr:PQQ-dependent sugar dehydrogenase [Phycisphaerae bacterium]